MRWQGDNTNDEELTEVRKPEDHWSCIAHLNAEDM